jgi:hypothetical protein
MDVNKNVTNITGVLCKELQTKVSLSITDSIFIIGIIFDFGFKTI